MARKYITGDKELEKRLRWLADKAADRVARSATGAGLTVIAKAQKKAAPEGPTGNTKASIGKRFERKARTGFVTAKAGVNVGKRSKRKGRIAPHSHLVALGTRPRVRKSGGSTGVMPANPWIKTSTQSALGAVKTRMTAAATKALAREARRALKL